MCFKVVFDKILIGKIPAFYGLMNESYPQGNISAFKFPQLPLLTSESPQEAVTAQWGLIPSWVKEVERAKKIRSGTVNARSESVHEKPSFRNSWPQNRCILPVTGFFEPHEIKDDSGMVHKESWQITRKDRTLFYLGGIYAHTPEVILQSNKQEDLFGFTHKEFYEISFSLLTLEAVELLAEIHNGKLRMPMIMSEEKALEWISQKAGDPSLLLDSHWQMDQEVLTGHKVDSQM